jgi:hypothetical protein
MTHKNYVLVAGKALQSSSEKYLKKRLIPVCFDSALLQFMAGKKSGLKKVLAHFFTLLITICKAYRLFYSTPDFNTGMACSLQTISLTFKSTIL